MRRSFVLPFLFVAVLAFTPAATSQIISQSSNYQLSALSLDGSGGGTSSLSYSSWIALGEVDSGPLLSGNYQARVGFLGGNDPQPTNAPIIFGATPDFGPTAGGNAFTISGLNFDKFGTGPLVSVLVDGNPAVANVLSNTQISALSPAGTSGPKALTVNNPFGSGLDPDGYIYTPAIITSAVVPIGSNLTIRNYGPVGDTYRVFVSTSSWSAMTKFGTLLIGPVPLFELMSFPYPGPDGISSVDILVPNDPILHGLTVYFQSLSVSDPSPLTGELTNASVMFIP